jgi:hypothetical protein
MAICLKELHKVNSGIAGGPFDFYSGAFRVQVDGAAEHERTADTSATA